MQSFFGRMLDPIDWLVETIVAILVLLTFTLAFAFYELNADPDFPVTVADVNELIVGILGATLAWGMINGVLYAMVAVFERGESHRLLTNIQNATTQAEGVEASAEELDHILEPITGQEKRQVLYTDILEHLHDSQPQPVRLKGEDMVGAVGCIVVAIIAVLPSLLPLLLLRSNYELAMRLSNLISLAVLFYAGYSWGKYSGSNPWKIGVFLVLMGVLLVMIALPLGG
jgi:VIT1/CCC1 family predicted Fe2+/Mn2+ transporter